MKLETGVLRTKTYRVKFQEVDTLCDVMLRCTWLRPTLLGGDVYGFGGGTGFSGHGWTNGERKNSGNEEEIGRLVEEIQRRIKKYR
ncbi:MAG: hypothetical protein O7D30_04035 [Rickettsia endosymbiont of Ixodes persulcatus]|nr:hypothetical protein [Rickettsia endosymbiont of Ixodes persulcatus]